MHFGAFSLLLGIQIRASYVLVNRERMRHAKTELNLSSCSNCLTENVLNAMKRTTAWRDCRALRHDLRQVSRSATIFVAPFCRFPTSDQEYQSTGTIFVYRLRKLSADVCSELRP